MLTQFRLNGTSSVGSCFLLSRLKLATISHLSYSTPLLHMSGNERLVWPTIGAAPHRSLSTHRNRLPVCLFLFVYVCLSLYLYKYFEIRCSGGAPYSACASPTPG